MPAATRSEASMAPPARLLARQGSPVAKRCAQNVAETMTNTKPDPDPVPIPTVIAGPVAGDAENGLPAVTSECVPGRAKRGRPRGASAARRAATGA